MYNELFIVEKHNEFWVIDIEYCLLLPSLFFLTKMIEGYVSNQENVVSSSAKAKVR